MTEPNTQREVTERIIAEVVNETLPSNEQMKTVRILRKVIPEHFATELTKAREETKEALRPFIQLHPPFEGKTLDEFEKEALQSYRQELRTRMIEAAEVDNNLYDMETGKTKALYLNTVLTIISE